MESLKSQVLNAQAYSLHQVYSYGSSETHSLYMVPDRLPRGAHWHGILTTGKVAPTADYHHVLGKLLTLIYPAHPSAIISDVLCPRCVLLPHFSSSPKIPALYMVFPKVPGLFPLRAFVCGVWR